MNTTIAVVSRIYIGEIPYIISFIEYYISIGISKFYFIVTDNKNYDLIKDLLKKYDKYICYFVHKKSIKNLDRDSFKNIEKIIKEEYILNVDIDEFLYLKKGIFDYKFIQDLIKDYPADKYIFDWIMVVNDGICNKESGFIKKKMGKVMVKSSAGISSILCHDIILKKKDPKIFYDNIYILHYWGRSMNDIIVKCIYGNLPDKKTTNLEEIIKNLENNILPVRFKLMALLSKTKKEIRIPNYVADKIDVKLESQLINRFYLQDKLLELYKNYIDKLDNKLLEEYQNENNTLLKILNKMPK